MDGSLQEQAKTTHDDASSSCGDTHLSCVDDLTLSQQLQQDLTLDDHEDDQSASVVVQNNPSRPTTTPKRRRQQPMVLLCDLGYGIPKEARPRKEKILAIAKQLVNFLTWQQQQHIMDNGKTGLPAARVEIVSCPHESVQDAIQERMQDLWKQQSTILPFPSNFAFSPHSLEDWVKAWLAKGTIATTTTTTVSRNNDVVYLSPDAPQTLDPTVAPPRVAVVGLLIDRRTILTNKSRDRAQTLDMKAARWPLEQFVANISAHEPLNVDCVLQGMQLWEWGYDCATDHANVSESARAKQACADALIQALQHHAQRHPERPIHKQIAA